MKRSKILDWPPWRFFFQVPFKILLGIYSCFCGGQPMIFLHQCKQRKRVKIPPKKEVSLLILWLIILANWAIAWLIACECDLGILFWPLTVSGKETNYYFICEKLMNLYVYKNGFHFIPSSINSKRIVIDERIIHAEFIQEFDLSQWKPIELVQVGF